MPLVDYTHPGRVPPLHLPLDRRSSSYYLRLDELPAWHPYHAREWALFRYPEWLDGGSAWLQAGAISENLAQLAAELGTPEEFRPVVGSAEHGFDEALAQALRILGWRPMVAEVIPHVDVLTKTL